MCDMNAKYTVLLKTIMEHPETKDKLANALSSYPIYTINSDLAKELDLVLTRDHINTKLLNHYKYREIGFETIGRFLDELEISMNEIMPYYNQMLHTLEITYNLDNIFDNVDMVHEMEEKTTDATNSKENSKTTSTANNTSTNTTTASDEQTSNTTLTENGKGVKSETPQSELSVPAKGINSVSYADEVNWNEKENTSQGTTSGTTESTSNLSTDEIRGVDTEGESESESTKIFTHKFRRKGNQGVNTYAHDIIEFRTSLVNIEQMIINDERISELFMRVF